MIERKSENIEMCGRQEDSKTPSDVKSGGNVLLNNCYLRNNQAYYVAMFKNNSHTFRLNVCKYLESADTRRGLLSAQTRTDHIVRWPI